MILGAGRGTRLGALGLTVPKVLVDVAGRPLLERQVDYLGGQGIERVVVNAHHLSEAIDSFAAEYMGPVELTVVTEPELLGTAGGVRNALDLLGSGPFVVLYGDVVVAEPLGPVLEAHDGRGAAATVTVYETDDVDGKGTVVVDADGWVERFAEKEPNVPTPALVNAGIYVVEPDFIGGLSAGTEIDFGHDVFPAALERGERILAYKLAQPVIDVGTPDGLERARSKVAGP